MYVQVSFYFLIRIKGNIRAKFGGSRAPFEEINFPKTKSLQYDN